MKVLTRLILFILVLLQAFTALQATAPHPRVREMIRDGVIPEPYYLQNLAELHAVGVNNPSRLAQGALQKNLSVPYSPFPAERLQSVTGQLKALVILIDFSDNMHTTEPAYFDSLLFDSSAVSMRDYYREVTYGAIDIVTVDFPSAVGWARADSVYSYYVNGENGMGYYPTNSQRLVEEAVLAVDPIVDFREYDNDGDGRVDALFIVHSGPGAEFTGSDDDIWSHAWATRNEIVLDHGVRVLNYTIEPEYLSQPGDMTIGVFAHELGHTLFYLPDLYDRDPFDSQGLESWSLMAGGSWLGPAYRGGSPAHPDAYSRIRMGYATPVNVSADLISEAISPVAVTPQVYRLHSGGMADTEYFLAENRQRYGYDSWLPGSGLLIYHIDELQMEPQNDYQWYPGYTSSGNYLAALEQADGFYHLEQGYLADDGDPFPGSTWNTAFSNTSAPSSISYAGAWTGIAVENITASDSLVWADLKVSFRESLALTSVTDTPADNGGWITIAWESAATDTADSSEVKGYSVWLQDDDLFPVGSDHVLPYTGGQWVYRGYLEANGSTGYSLDVPSLIDSNASGIHLSYVRVAALDQDSSVFAISDVVSGYSADNLAPATPVGLTASLEEGGLGIRITWLNNDDTDLAEYRVYRGADSTFIPLDPDIFLAATADTFYYDSNLVPGEFYYRLAAFDINGNRSDYTGSVAPTGLVSADGDRVGIPLSYRLYQNYPNPFNPVTTIRFDLPIAGYVRILVFDLQGREIRRLVDDWRQPGQHLTQWDGRAGDGRESSAGIYILRLETQRFVTGRKMVLLK